MFQRALILSASAGAGHVRAAQALEKAFEQVGAAKNVRHVDTLEYTNEVFRGLYSKAYVEMIKRAPTALGWLYDRLDEPFVNERTRTAFNKLNTAPFVRMLRDAAPDVAVSTHFLPAEIISGLKDKGKFEGPSAIVVTDLDVHGMWLCHNYDHYFVALDETREHLEKLGVPADKITVSGIPIDPVFARPADGAAMRRKHGLGEGMPTILLSAGGFGVGPVEGLVAALGTLRHECQVVAVCGRNEKLRARLEKLADPGGRVHFKIIGFTTEMDELMACSDLLVGKPGGLTTSEALARGLIPVIVNPIPGQEERNSDHLLEEGAAIRCNNLPTLPYKIDRLLDDPARMSAMRTNVRRLARPNAAVEIVKKLLSLQAQWEKQPSKPRLSVRRVRNVRKSRV